MVKTDLPHVRLAAIKFGHRRECAGIFNLVGDTRQWPLSRKRMDHENAKREAVDGRVVVWLIHQRFRRHVARRARSFRHSTLCGWRDIEDFGDSEVGDLGLEGGGEENIVGRQVSVYDGRRLLVEVAQAQGHVGENVVVRWGVGHSLLVQVGSQSGVQTLHHETWHLAALLEVDPQELHYVGVLDALKEFALVSEAR